MEKPELSAEKLQDMVESAMDGLKIFNIIETSIELGIFDILTKKTTCNHLSEEIGIEKVFTCCLLEVLVKLGLLEKIEDEKAVKHGKIFYKNTKLADLYLNSKSDYKRIKSLLSIKENAKMWNNLQNTMRGEISRPDEDVFPSVVKLMAEDCLSGELQDTVRMVAEFDEFKSSKTLLDLGGGHGLYSIAMSELNPELQAYVFDLPKVVDETQKFIDRYSSRVKTIPGNFYLDDFGGTYDIIFSSCNPSGKNPKIAKKVYDSLNVDGLFVNKQNFPERTDNSLNDFIDDLEWNFTHLERSTKTERKFGFLGDLSFKDYTKYLEDMGFSVIKISEINHLKNPFGRKSQDKIIIAKKVG
jgi:hypothetical protein